MRTVVDAFKALMVGGGLLVELGKVPVSGGWVGTPGVSTFNRYGVIYPLDSPTDGPLNCGDRDYETRIQVTLVGPTVQSTLAYADAAVAALSGKRITTSMRVTTRPIFVDQYGSVDPEDTDKNVRIYTVKHIFGVHTTPVSPA